MTESTLLVEMERLFPYYLLAGVRAGGLFIATPMLNARGIPVTLKAGLPALLGVLAILPWSDSLPDLGFDPVCAPLAFGLLLLRELGFGMVLGFAVTLVIGTIYVAGQLMDVPMGFGIAHVVDPSLGIQVPVMTQFQYILLVVLFFGIGGHHAVISALADSYLLFPPGKMAWPVTVASEMVDVFSTTFLLALRLAAPVVAAVFLADVGLGIIARTVPQINVFVIGIPAKILIGIAVFMVALPAYVWLVSRLCSRMGMLGDVLARLLVLFGGGT